MQSFALRRVELRLRTELQLRQKPHVAELLPDENFLLIGLANDEIGYLIPKRQWDQRPPYCYGRKRDQYGEINSCSPEAAGIVLKSLAACVVKQRASAER